MTDVPSHMMRWLPVTETLIPRPIWRRVLNRQMLGDLLHPPNDAEKRDAIAVLREVVVHDRMLSVDAMMLWEATRILDEYGQ
jgi:hypothetical protein